MTLLQDEFIRDIPKTDLHVHLDGSLRLDTLIALARQQGVTLPSYSPEGLLETVFKAKYGDLGEYLRGFAYTCSVLQTNEALEQAAFELAEDAYGEGVRYIEPRFAPQLHIARAADIPAVLAAVERGLKRAADTWNARPAVAEGHEPAYGYGIIVCAMRMFAENFSAYFRRLLEVHSFAPRRDAFGLASLELARAAIQAREAGVSVVGFDLAGQENGYPARDHGNAYRHAHQSFLNKTVHAGEAYGAESIFEAITALHADRLGHGYYLFDTDKITDPAIDDRERYIWELAEFIADRRITIEVCLTSNLQTNPSLISLDQHPARHMIDHKISIAFCTDNRLVSRTTVSREIGLAVTWLGLTPRQLRDSVINGFKRSFMPMTYLKKRDYVREIIDYYAEIERRHGIDNPLPE